MKTKNLIPFVTVLALLTLCPFSAKAQFEFGPTVGVGAVMDKTIKGAGFSSDLGISARYTFLNDAPVSVQLRLDAMYGYIHTGSLRKNVIQHVRFGADENRFACVWTDHIIRIPLTVGIRLNKVLDGRMSLRTGVYYGRGIAGKVRYFETPDNLTFPELNSYRSISIKGNVNGYDGNFMTLAQNEHRFGVIAGVDVNVYKKLDLSIYYMGDLTDSWVSAYKPYVILKSLKLGLSYWF